MQYSQLPLRRGPERHTPVLLLACLATVLASPQLFAQQTSSSAEADQPTNQQLLQRIAQLETRLQQVEAVLAKVQAKSEEPSPMQEPAAAPLPTRKEPEAEHAADHTGESMDLNKTLLRVRGFGDVNLIGTNQPGHPTTFALGQVDLFITSDVSEKFKFLSEVVFEAGHDNVFGVDIERFLLTYLQSDYLNLGVGRYHTAIGYYNTAFHHSTWFQTTTGRPFLFLFEDQGGILPIHNVGATATGRIPSGRLGLHYIAEVGNGRASNSKDSEAVQNTVDENARKAVNFQVFARPEGVPGLQAGFSVYRDLLAPQGLPRIGETIFDLYGVYNNRRFEWLNEALLIRHGVHGTPNVFNTPGFYTQLSRRWGSYRPYFRYQYVNAANDEPVFYTNVGLRHGPSFGIRYDASDFVALKLQYDYTLLRGGLTFSTVTAQAGFTF